MIIIKIYSIVYTLILMVVSFCDAIEKQDKIMGFIFLSFIPILLCLIF